MIKTSSFDNIFNILNFTNYVWSNLSRTMYFNIFKWPILSPLNEPTLLAVRQHFIEKKKHYPFTTSTKQTSFKNWYRYAKLNLEAILIEMVVFQSLYWTTQPPSSLIIIRMKITGAHPHFISKDAIYRRLAGSRNRTACHNLVV